MAKRAKGRNRNNHGRFEKKQSSQLSIGSPVSLPTHHNPNHPSIASELAPILQDNVCLSIIDDADCEFTSEEEADEDAADGPWISPAKRKTSAETMQRFEAMMDGGDKTRKKRGKYKVFGPSLRTIQDWKQRARTSFKSGQISLEMLNKQLQEIEKKASGNKQVTLQSFFAKRSSDEMGDATQPRKKRKVVEPIEISSDEDNGGVQDGEFGVWEEVDEVTNGHSDEISNGGPIQLTFNVGASFISSEAQDEINEEDEEEAANDARTQTDFVALRDATRQLYNKFYDKKQFDSRSTRAYAALYTFYKHLCERKNLGRIASSMLVASELLRGPAFARRLRAHARNFEAHGEVLPSRRGYGAKLSGLLDNEQVILEVKSWLRTLPVGTVTPSLLQKHLNCKILPNAGLRKLSISRRQVRRWLRRLGYRRKAHSKGVYWDGHERKDVVKRRKEYLQELKDIEQ
jgi:hypothetical protein